MGLKEYGELAALVLGIIATFLTIYFKLPQLVKKWWVNRHGVRLRKLEEEMGSMKELLETMTGIGNDVREGHNTILSRLDNMGKSIAYNAADLATVMGSGICTFKTDEDGRWTQASPGLKELTGLGWEELKDFNFINAIEPLQKKGFFDRYQHAVVNGIRIDDTVVIKGHKCRIKAHRMEGNGAGYIGYSGTITVNQKSNNNE